MPLLGPSDPLPTRPCRVLVAGASGAGKTTLAKALARRFGLRRIELDALHHGPQWTPRPEFTADVTRLTAEPNWVTEWQYNQVRQLLLDRADTLVWLDHSRALVMRRVVARTLRRWARREVLWNGNREPPLRTLFTDPEHIIRLAWHGPARTAQRLSDLLAGEHGTRLTVVRLRGQRQVDAWLSGPVLAAAPSGLSRE